MLGYFQYDLKKVDSSSDPWDDVRYEVSAIARWHCKSEQYTIVGNSKFFCKENGNWSSTEEGVAGDQQLELPKCGKTATSQHNV